MDIWRSLAGMVCLDITSASAAQTLSYLNSTGIYLYDVQLGQDDLQVTFSVSRKDARTVKKLATKRGDQVKIISRQGIYWTIKGLLRRPLLLAAMCILLFIVATIPTRVFFFQVEGNDTVPTRLILEKCEQCGLRFGSAREKVRSEKIKNALLEAIPQLQWAGVNTSGCVATVTVRERSIEEKPESPKGIASIVASRDGIITECTVTKGNAVCKVGQAVREGQVLISGYTDCGISIRAEQAQGEVYAETQRTLTAKIPAELDRRGQLSGQIKKYSLIIGKKRINFYKGSGIPDTSCDKMYLESYVTLPGGFQLPIAIVTEILSFYETETAVLSPDDAQGILLDFSDRYLQGQMVAGQITNRQETISSLEDHYELLGQYACKEMIGLTQNEEIIKPYGKHD